MDLNKIDTLIEKINEGKEVPELFIEKLRDMTDRNDHGNARYEIAKFIKNRKLMKIYKAMMDVQDALGFLPQGFIDARYQIDKDFLYPAVSQKFGKQGLSQIYNTL